MHSYTSKHYSFYYNSDFSGKVIVHCFKTCYNTELELSDLIQFVIQTYVNDRLHKVFDNLLMDV